jgi:hypothetical protein
MRKKWAGVVTRGGGVLDVNGVEIKGYLNMYSGKLYAYVFR